MHVDCCGKQLKDIYSSKIGRIILCGSACESPQSLELFLHSNSGFALMFLCPGPVTKQCPASLISAFAHSNTDVSEGLKNEIERFQTILIDMGIEISKQHSCP